MKAYYSATELTGINDVRWTLEVARLWRLAGRVQRDCRVYWQGRLVATTGLAGNRIGVGDFA